MWLLYSLKAFRSAHAAVKTLREHLVVHLGLSSPCCSLHLDTHEALASGAASEASCAPFFGSGSWVFFRSVGQSTIYSALVSWTASLGPTSTRISVACFEVDLLARWSLGTFRTCSRRLLDLQHLEKPASLDLCDACRAYGAARSGHGHEASCFEDEHLHDHHLHSLQRSEEGFVVHVFKVRRARRGAHREGHGR